MTTAIRIKETGTVTALHDAVTAVVPYLNTAAGAVQVTGTWAGACVLEGTLDNTTWAPFAFVDVATGATGTTITANGVYRTELVGVSMVRVRRSTATSGSAVLTLIVQGN